MFGIEAIIAATVSSAALEQARLDAGGEPIDKSNHQYPAQSKDDCTEFLKGVIVGEIISGGN